MTSREKANHLFRYGTIIEDKRSPDSVFRDVKIHYGTRFFAIHMKNGEVRSVEDYVPGFETKFQVHNPYLEEDD